MKGKFDFARALVLGALLAGDLYRARPGLRGVDEIYAQGLQMPILESELVGTRGKRAETAENSI